MTFDQLTDLRNDGPAGASVKFRSLLFLAVLCLVLLFQAGVLENFELALAQPKVNASVQIAGKNSCPQCGSSRNASPNPGSAASSRSLVISNPTSSSIVRATTTFRVQAEKLPSLYGVEYVLNGRRLYSGGDPIGPVTTPPYDLSWNTANVWDGDMRLKAIATDRSGNIIATSPEVQFQIANGPTRLTLLSPNPSHALTGKVDWVLETNYPAGRPAKIFQCFTDGKLFALEFTQSQQIRFSLDTAQSQNGPHELFCALWIETNPAYPAAMSQVLVRFDNGRSPMELRTNFRELYTVPGDSVILTAKLVCTDLAEESTQATFTSADPSVAMIESGHVVKAIAPGVTTIAVSSGSRSAAVRVIVNRSRIFPHFSKSGELLPTFNSQSSIFLNTLFFLDANQVIHTPALGPLLRRSGVTALTSGFYYNPGDNPANEDWFRWQPGMDSLLDDLEYAAARNRLSIFLTGDDIARTDAEFYNSITSRSSAEKIQYVMKWATKTRRVVGIDLIDEADALWGDTPTPNDGRWLTLARPVPDTGFRQLMNILNSHRGRPPISFPVVGLASATTAMNWQGNPSFSDFASVYWTFVINSWRHAYPWSYSLHQIFSNIENVLAARLPVLQRDKPLLLLTSLAGPYYKKLGPGNQFIPGQDQLLAPGNTPESVAAQIMFAAAKGFAGVRVYGFDQMGAKSDRKNGAIGSSLQTFANPFEVGVQRWQAMSAAFNLIQALRQYILQPQTHAVDLGPTVFTGAKDGPNGRLFFAINGLEGSQVIRVDLAPYVYTNGSSIQRYRLVGANLASESLPRQTTDVLTLQPGEATVWLIRPATSGDGASHSLASHGRPL
jgi:hypothetical protein